MNEFENTVSYITEKLYNKNSIIVNKNIIKFQLYNDKIQKFITSHRRYKRENPEIKNVVKSIKLHFIKNCLEKNIKEINDALKHDLTFIRKWFEIHGEDNFENFVVSDEDIKKGDKLNLINVVNQINEKLTDCKMNEIISLTDFNDEYMVDLDSDFVESEINFKLQIDAKNKENISNVDCSIFTIKKEYLSNQLFNSKDFEREKYINFGILDSETEPAYEGRGYNKFLRSLAYYIMYKYFDCYLLGTESISKTTVHILQKYFKFNVLADDYSIKNLNIDITNIADERQIELANKISKSLSLNINMITDLTDPKKKKFIEFMYNEIINCHCPPCKNYLKY